MASGLPHAQWNNGDVTDASLFNVEDVRAWYATRAHGAGVPWGVRVPAGMPFMHGRRVFRKRCMGLFPSEFCAFGPPTRIEIRAATPDDIETVARIEPAFDEAEESIRRWVGPHLAAPGFSVALARLDGEPVGLATAIFTDDRAGRCASASSASACSNARGGEA